MQMRIPYIIIRLGSTRKIFVVVVFSILSTVGLVLQSCDKYSPVCPPTHALIYNNLIFRFILPCNHLTCC